jgi:DedD protein
MSDEGLHEIQLNGKQLVFLFMTATVVAVVIFLCGVMVGRGVPTQRGVPVLAADGSDPTTTDEARTSASAIDTAATPTASSSPSASPSSKLGLTYPNRLEEPEPVPEDVPAGLPAHEPFATTAVARVPPPSPEPKPAAKPKAAAAAVATAATAPSKEPADAVPSGPGFVVQVAAVRQRTEADAIRGRLARKGYPAFVATAGTAGAPTYRVRVGKYPSRREADTIAAKLEREEQFKPWVTR